MAAGFALDWEQIGAGISAIGALGVAAFGVTEALGKALAFRTTGRRFSHFGLPYAGFQAVKAAIRPLAPALRTAYGPEFLDVLAQQYRSGRSQGSAPDTIRQGVRLALPFMDAGEAAEVIGNVWAMGETQSRGLALALQANSAQQAAAERPPGVGDPGAAPDQMQALAGRFATALDARVSAAFDLAEERYEAQAKMWSGVVAVALALGFNSGLGASHLSWPLALAVGVVAVPLAPVAKDLSTSLQNALTAFKAIPGRPG